MKTLSRFVTKFTSLIVAVLSCFDRVLFKGHLPITNGPALEGFVDHVLKIRRCDFMDFAQEQSDAVVDHAKRMAEEAGVEYRFLQGSHRKDKLVDEILRQRSDLVEGLICVFCCMECCPSFRLASGKDRPRLVNARRQQRVLYFYVLDPQLGLIHIRLTTWFPFSIQVYVNGHSWLAQEMLKRRLGFNLQDNAFTALEDSEAAQKLADSFVNLDWKKILDRLARQVNPLLFKRWFRGLSYYWVVDQAEYATDLIFTGREALAGLYPRLLDHAAVNFSAKDILTFLGRRFHPRFDGEVLTSCQKGRWPGARIKHRVKNNWLKMYDKFGWVLRIETVINDPREFRVRRLRSRGPPGDDVVPDEQGGGQPVPLPRGGPGVEPALPRRAGGGGRPAAGVSSDGGADRAGGGVGAESCRLQPGQPRGCAAVPGGARRREPAARLSQRRHPHGVVRDDRG